MCRSVFLRIFIRKLTKNLWMREGLYVLYRGRGRGGYNRNMFSAHNWAYNNKGDFMVNYLALARAHSIYSRGYYLSSGNIKHGVEKAGNQGNQMLQRKTRQPQDDFC